MNLIDEPLPDKVKRQGFQLDALERRFEELSQRHAGAGASNSALGKGLRAASGAILLLILTQFVTSCFQVQAERSRQIFSARTDLLQGLIREAGRLEEEARRLQWRLYDDESIVHSGEGTRGLLSAQARSYMGDSRDLLQRFQGMAFPREWDDPNTPQGKAKKKAWYEVYALMTCVSNSSIDGDGEGMEPIKNKIQWGLENDELTKELAEEIEEGSKDDPPCAENFSPEVFQVVRARASEETWKHFEGNFLNWLF